MFLQLMRYKKSKKVEFSNLVLMLRRYNDVTINRKGDEKNEKIQNQ